MESKSVIDAHDRCEGCEVHEDQEALRAIKMKQGRRRMLCRGCFMAAAQEGDVDPTDPRVS